MGGGGGIESGEDGGNGNLLGGQEEGSFDG